MIKFLLFGHASASAVGHAVSIGTVFKKNKTSTKLNVEELMDDPR
jgi:hypothetical protein